MYHTFFNSQEESHNFERQMRRLDSRGNALPTSERSWLRQTGPASKELTTADGAMWTGTVYMGSQNQALNVIFDNASDWLVVEGSSCDSCQGSTFNVESSTTGQQVNDKASYRYYGATTMRGNEWKDQVCVTASACINDFEYFLITEQQGLQEPVDGVFGLARHKAFYLNSENGVKRGPSYIMAMKNANLISEATFSISLSPFGEQSFIDFGQPKQERMKY